MPGLDLPEWVMRFVVLILVLGFPLALFLAWAYEVTPEGIKRTKQVPSARALGTCRRGFLIASQTLMGDVEAAEAEYARAVALYGDVPFLDQFMLWQTLGMGDVAGAVEFVTPGPINAAAAAKLDSPSEALADLKRLHADSAHANQVARTAIAMWAVHFGDPVFALEVMQQLAAANTQNVFWLWYPQMRDVRRLPGFKEIIRSAGFVDYWNTFGWPEACRPTGGEDFECA